MRHPLETVAPERRSPAPPARGTPGNIEFVQMNSYTKPIGKATGGATFRDQAVALARQGFRVFPLNANGKDPAIEGWPELASDDPERVLRFWSEPFNGDPIDYNIGIATGAGLVVIDVDNKNGKNGSATWKAIERQHGVLPHTLAVITPNRGAHFYARDAGQRWFPNSAGKLGEGVDVKGERGYVVGPGSVIDGKPYKIIADHPIAQIPEALASLIATTKPDRNSAAVESEHLDTLEAIARATEWLKTAEPSIENAGGDDTAFRTAARVMDFGVTPSVVLELMLEHWNERCRPPWEPEHLEVKVGNATEYRQRPIGADSADVEFDVVELETKRTGEAWAEPENLEGDPLKNAAPPDLIEDVFPPTAQDWLDDEAERKGVGRGPTVLAALVMFAGSISARHKVQVKQNDTGFTERPILWGALIGGPGSGKSPILSAVMRPLRAVEDDRRRAFQTELRAYETGLKTNKVKHAQAAAADASKPRNRCRLVMDATTESVVVREAHSGHGVTLFHDELSGWIGSFDAYRSGKGGGGGKDAAFWLSAKNGGSWDVTRVSREAVSAELHAANILGGIQPEVLRKASVGWGENGMLQRFLLCSMGRSQEAPDRAPNDTLADAVADAVRRLSALDPDLATPPFRMAAEADVSRQRVVQFGRSQMDRGDIPSALRGWLDKMEGEWARIALVLHLVEWALGTDALFDDPPLLISPEIAQRAERFLLGYQWQQQQFFYRHVIGNDAVQSGAVRKIADHLLAHELRQISNRDLQQGIRTITDRDERAAAMIALARAGWVRALPSPKGGQPSRWEVNPKVHERNSARAVEEAQRKFTAHNAILRAGAERRANSMAEA